MIENLKTRITSVNLEEDLSSEPPCLVIIYPTGSNLGRRFRLNTRQVTIGRDPESDIVVDLDSVSRRHATIHLGSMAFVEDHGSTNGTYVNQRPVKQHTLQDGDQLKIGTVIFKFIYGGNVEASYHEAIYRMTIYDGLTEVYNKRYFQDFLDRELSRCTRHNRPISLVMFDLDHFKRVNDSHGHLAGDHVLRQVAGCLNERIRREELLARYGGEEFVVVLPETDHAGAMAFAEQLRQMVEATPVVFEDDVIGVTISLGVATYRGRSIRAEALIAQAGAKLYEAKNSGRNRVCG